VSRVLNTMVSGCIVWVGVRVRVRIRVRQSLVIALLHVAQSKGSLRTSRGLLCEAHSRSHTELQDHVLWRLDIVILVRTPSYRTMCCGV